MKELGAPAAFLEGIVQTPYLEDAATRERFPFRPPWAIILLAWAVRFSATIDLISAVFRVRFKLVQTLSPWSPFEISQGFPLCMVLTSALLFILASGLVKGKRVAWFLTIGALTIAPILHLGRAVIWPQALINLSVIGYLILHHRYFVTRSDWKSVRFALVICPLLASALLIFGSVRLHHLRFQTSGGDDWISCIQAAFELVLVHNSFSQQPQTVSSANFFAVLQVSGATIALTGLVLSLRPVLIRRRLRSENRERAWHLIDKYGKDPLDTYALLNDKSYFFTRNGLATVPYVLSGNLAIALADPVGHPLQRSSAISDFARYCRVQDWEPVFYEITDELIPFYQQAEFSVFKIGEEACLRTDEFHLKGGDFQNLRTACNAARKLGFQFRWYDATADGIDEPLEHQLAEISRRWLQEKNTREMTFDMGSFALEEIRQNGAAVAIDASGKALAFTTWRPFAGGSGQTLDLMRSLPHKRNVMDFVLVESIHRFRRLGIHDVSLGNAPLANATSEDAPLQAEEKVVQFLFENLNRIYGYRSLFEFKRKYRPTWRGRYIAYRRGVHLPLVGLGLVRVHAPEGLFKFLLR
jgi:phosphatidylglycerol lysyltransferase